MPLRNPLRTEGEAFGFLLAAVAVFGVVGVAGALAGGAAALAAFLAAAVGIGAGIWIASEPKEREPAVWERGGPDSERSS